MKEFEQKLALLDEKSSPEKTTKADDDKSPEIAKNGLIPAPAAVGPSSSPKDEDVEVAAGNDEDVVVAGAGNEDVVVAAAPSSPKTEQIPENPASTEADLTTTTTEDRSLTEEEKIARKRAKKQRQQQNKEQRKQDRIADRAKEMEGFVPLAERESQRMDRQLKAQGMQIKDIPSDGNCLFRAIKDQMDFNEVKGFQELDHTSLRSLCADTLDRYRDEYAVFMPEDEPDFDAYLRKIRDHLWGGDMEINALSRALRSRIFVYQGEGEPVLKFGEDIKNPEGELRITFHKYLYACAHYNSLRPL